MRFYTPTNCLARDIFRAPEEARPFIDLPMTQRPEELPPELYQANTGVTRFANLIIGLAVDGAIDRGVSPERIRGAFDEGHMTARATVDQRPRVAQTPAYVGHVVMRGRELQVGIGTADGSYLAADARVHFLRQGNLWVPHTTEVMPLDGSDMHVTDIPSPFELSGAPGTRMLDIPAELDAAAFMGGNEAVITGMHTLLDMRGDMWDLA